MTLGNRIVIVGVSASGKSTFARRLAEKITLPLVHIDAVMWKPGWEYIGDEQTVQKLDEVTTGDQWVLEGYIKKQAYPFVFERADTIIYLDYARHVAASRYLKRWITHRKTARPELEGSPDTFSFKFMRLVWDKKEVYWMNRFLKDSPYQSKIVTLSSPKGAENLLKRV